MKISPFGHELQYEVAIEERDLSVNDPTLISQNAEFAHGATNIGAPADTTGLRLEQS